MATALSNREGSLVPRSSGD